MYFRNVSETMSITVNTVVGKLGVKPGECIELNEKIYPPLPSTLRKITEEEYLSFREGKQPVNTPHTEEKTGDIPKSGQVDTELDKSNDQINNPVSVTETNTIESTIENALKDPGIMDFVRGLLNKGVMEQPQPGQPVVEKVEEKPKEDIKPQKALKVQDVKKTDVEKSIDEQIAELKQTWLETKNARKKEKLQKQIKELQKQSEKLKSNKGDE